MADGIHATRQSPRFLLLYALAWAGGSVAYVPFLTLLLPIRVSALASGSAAVAWLAYLAFAGAISASLANIGFGYLSDITGNRRGWIALGLVLSCVLLLALGKAAALPSLVALLFAWQISLNMILAPLSAWAGDCVPDDQKGLLGGLLAFAPAIGALAATFVTIPGMASADARLVLIGMIVVCCILPVLIAGNPARVDQPVPVGAQPDGDEEGRQSIYGNRAARRMWLARLAMQVAEAALFSFLYFWFRSIDPMMNDHRTARVFSSVMVLSAPIALLIGHWADRRDRPFVPLIVCAGLASLGLCGMALSRTLATAIATYAVFAFATSVFLALHTAQTLRVLPRTDRRGRDLGLFNLTNTVPSLLMPWLTLALVPTFGFSALFLLLSGLALVAGLLLLSLSRRF